MKEQASRKRDRKALDKKQAALNFDDLSISQPTCEDRDNNIFGGRHEHERTISINELDCEDDVDPRDKSIDRAALALSYKT